MVILGLSQAPGSFQSSFKEIARYPLLVWDRNKMPAPLNVVQGYPTTVVIDRSSKVRKVIVGPAGQALETVIQEALKEKASTPQAQKKA